MEVNNNEAFIEFYDDNSSCGELPPLIAKDEYDSHSKNSMSGSGDDDSSLPDLVDREDKGSVMSAESIGYRLQGSLPTPAVEEEDVLFLSF